MSDMHAHSVAFVRETAIPPSPAPANATGPVKWLRENLFATWANALLTVLAILVIYLVLAKTLPWMLNGIWNTSSLSECREVLAGKTGACFSVLADRWYQLLFGFKYPSAFYWRPTLALVLLFLAAAPVLFFDLPRKLLIFTALYPFIAFWLIWGGPVLVPLFALLGFVAGYVVFSRLVTDSFAKGFFGAIVAALVVWFVGSLVNGALAVENPVLPAVPSRDLGEGIKAMFEKRKPEFTGE